MLLHGLAQQGEVHGTYFVCRRGLEGTRASKGEAGETLFLGPFLCLAATVIKPDPLAFFPWPGRFKRELG